jgi:hypothetical protein
VPKVNKFKSGKNQMTTFNYPLEDLPLITVGDVEACLINGEVVIEYDRAGLWEVRRILVDGYRTGSHDNKLVYAVPPLVIETMITERLYGSWHDKVQEAVLEQLDEDNARAAEDAADDERNRRDVER